MKLNDKQKLLTVALIGTLLVIALSATYAFFSYTRAGTTENTIKSGSITFLYDELNQEGNSIAITDAMPMTDTEGKAQDKYFNFKIVSKTGNTNSIPYDITVRKKDGSDNLDNYVKIYLAKIDNYNTTIANETEVALNTYNSLQDYSINNYTDKLVYRDIVPASSDSYTQFYRLKMWIDNSTPLSNETMNKTFTLTVNVYSNGHILDASSSNNEITSLSVGGNALTVTSTENNIDYYETTLPEGTTQTTITVETSDYTRTRITKTQSDYSTPIASSNNITKLSNTLNKTVNLTAGSNYFKIITISENGTEKETRTRIKVGTGLEGLAKNIYDAAVLNQGSILTNPTLTTTSQVANESGLYSINVTNGFGGEDGTSYYFRGNVNNNYVSFAGMTWRIIRINEDGTVRIMLAEGLNGNSQTKYNSQNAFSNNPRDMYYSNSEVVNTVNTWFTTNIESNDSYKAKLASGNYFCEQAKVGYDQRSIDKSNADMVLYSEYTPDLKCSLDGNNHQYVTGYVGLVSIDEAWLAGMYYNLNSNSYIADSNYRFWIMSPLGVGYEFGGSYADLTEKAVITAVNANGALNLSGTNNSSVVVSKPVVNLKSNVTATGTGTQADPYVIQ